MSELPKDSTEPSRWATIYEAMTGATAPGEHVEHPPGASAESQTAGHEADRFDARGILYVPALVIVTVILSYALITVLFNAVEIGKPQADASASEKAKEESAKPYAERVTRISSTDEKAPFAAPRLEYVKQLDNPKADPVFYRSYTPAASRTNTYEIRPQDLYPDRYTDPATGKKVLAEDAPLIPVNRAMHLLASKLPARKDLKPTTTTTDKAKLSNGGQPTASIKVAAAPVKAEEKH